MKKIVLIAAVAMMVAGAAVAQQPTKSNEQKQQNTEVRRVDDGQRRDDVRHHEGRPDREGMHRHDGEHRHDGSHHDGKHKKGPSRPADLQYNEFGIETTLAKAFPGARSVEKTEKWTVVRNAAGQLMGYGVYSKPASDGIKGFAGETPVLIALNTKKVIIGVYALPNIETPRFQQRVEEAGFFNNWNGLTIKKAKKKMVDTVSGATYTSSAVAKSVQAALEKL